MQINTKWLGTRHSAINLLFVALVVVGCIRPETPEPPATTLPPAISVAGSYDTAVTLAENSCGAVTVESMPTQVEQTPGGGHLILTHAGNDFNGALQPDATFITDPLILRGGGDTYTVTVQGHFTATGFDAQTTVAVHQARAPQNCQYTVYWVGSKQGTPNVIP